MAQARISRFTKNSDFTTQKQRGRYIASVSVPAGTYGFVTTFQTIIQIDEEKACIENVTLSSSFDAGATYSTHNLVYDSGDWRVYYLIYQAEPKFYAIRAVVVCPSGSANVPANSATAVINMSLSPFVN